VRCASQTATFDQLIPIVRNDSRSSRSSRVSRNIAARVQGLAEARAIDVTESVMSDGAVAERLRREGLTAVPKNGPRATLTA
jgi:hypothetical protein